MCNCVRCRAKDGVSVLIVCYLHFHPFQVVTEATLLVFSSEVTTEREEECKLEIQDPVGGRSDYFRPAQGLSSPCAPAFFKFFYFGCLFRGSLSGSQGASVNLKSFFKPHNDL